MNFSFSGIRRQLLLIFGIIMLPMLAHLWYAGHTQRAQALVNMEQQVASSIHLFSIQQRMLVEKAGNLLAVMTHLPTATEQERDQCQDSLLQIQDNYPEYATLLIMAPDGDVLCCSLPQRTTLNMADRPWFQQAVTSKALPMGSYMISRSSGKPSLPFAYPALDRQGDVKRILGTALDLTAYTRFLEGAPLPEAAEVIVVDRYGIILASSGTTTALSGKPLASFHNLSTTALTATDELQRLELGDRLFWLRTIEVNKDPNPISLVVTIPKSTLFAEATANQTTHGIGLLVAFLLIGGFAWYYIGRIIVSPIQTLMTQTRQISAGQLNQGGEHVKLTGEFRLLADDFAAMTAKLQMREEERDQAEIALRESERRYRDLFQQNPISLWEEDLSQIKTHFNHLKEQGVTDFNAYFDQHPEEIERCLAMIRILHVNQATLTLFEAKSENELLGSLEKIIPPTGFKQIQAELVAIAEGRPFSIEVENVTIGGRVFPAMINAALPEGYEQSWARVFISVFDLTDRKRIEQQQKELERQLMLAQKMETVGTLAGGIAHDFNNILSPIIGYAELSLAVGKLQPDTRSHLSKILGAAQRAKEMVHQILAFSRRQESAKEQISLAAITREVLELLRSSIPTTIAITSDLDQGLRPIFGDGSRIHQVIMNLCTNSYQALKNSGGTISVRVRAGQSEEQGHPVKSAPHLLLTVEDDGPGIPFDLQGKIFDPFFTTKAPGEGSGMGLAVVHGIIKDHGGIIEVTSTPGNGTRFDIFLPCIEQTEQTEAREEGSPLPTGDERILVVDDEESLVAMVRTILIKLGYSVAGFTSSLEALRAFQDAPTHFDLVLTDQTMPTLTGFDMAVEMLSTRPDMPIILYTGYSETVSPEQAAQAGISCFLHKPLSASQLAVSVRETLDLTRPS